MSLRKFQHQFPVVKKLTVGQEKPRKEPLGAGEDENKTRDKMHEVGKDVSNNENKGDVTDPSGAGEDEKKTGDKIDEVGKDVSNNENKGDVTDPFGAGEDEKKTRDKIHEAGEDISNNENKGDITDRNVHNEILFSCLNYFHENKLTRTLHTLEQEAHIFFNQNHVDEMIKEGKWDEALCYLSAFSGIDDDSSVEILGQVALQKFKESQGLIRKPNDISANCDPLKFDDARGMVRANIKKMVAIR